MIIGALKDYKWVGVFSYDDPYDALVNTTH